MFETKADDSDDDDRPVRSVKRGSGGGDGPLSVADRFDGRDSSRGDADDDASASIRDGGSASSGRHSQLVAGDRAATSHFLKHPNATFLLHFACWKGGVKAAQVRRGAFPALFVCG